MSNKSRGIFVALAWFLGGFGAHKFYLGQNKKGLLYLVFFWTFVPSFVGIVECFQTAFMSREEWDAYLTKATA